MTDVSDISEISLLINDLNSRLPEFLRPSDLVVYGLYKNRSDVCLAMKRGEAPPSIKISSHKVVFPKSGVCNWLLKKVDAEGCNVAYQA
jgi:predicted DNA-binding transcriptional regulator AlpA